MEGRRQAAAGLRAPKPRRFGEGRGTGGPLCADGPCGCELSERVSAALLVSSPAGPASGGKGSDAGHKGREVSLPPTIEAATSDTPFDAIDFISFLPSLFFILQI